MKPLSGTVDPDALAAELEAGNPIVVVEQPGLVDGCGDCGGPLVVEGFAAAPGGVTSVEVEISGRGSFAAEIDIARPDARLVLGDRPDARRPGFRAEIATDAWPPATLDMRIRVRGGAGGETLGWARPRWFRPIERFVDAARTGRCALHWVDPVLGSPAGELVLLSGVVASANGIERVQVEGPGIGTAEALLSPIPAVYLTYLPTPASWARNYSLRLDLGDVPPGPYPVAVTAVDGAGDSARLEGTLIVGAAERYARWRAARSDRAPVTASVRAPTLAMLGGDGRAAERAAAEQTLQPVAVEQIADGDDLGIALRAVVAGGIPMVVADAHDTLAPDALARLATVLRPSGGADAAYGDGEVDRNGQGVVPRFQPGWSPELLIGADYVQGPVGVGPAAAKAALEGWSAPPSTARELLLRLVDEPLEIARVPHVLATQQPRTADESEGVDRTIAAIADRRGRAVLREPTERAGFHRVRWPLRERPRVTIVIPTLGAEELLGSCLASLREATDYREWDAVLVDSGGGAPTPSPRGGSTPAAGARSPTIGASSTSPAPRTSARRRRAATSCSTSTTTPSSPIPIGSRAWSSTRRFRSPALSVRCC